MGLLSKEDILAASEIPSEEVDVPEWGGKVKVRALLAGEYDKYQQKLFVMNGDKVEQKFDEVTTALLCYAIVGGDNKPLFTQKELKELPSRPLRKLYTVAQRLNGETIEAKDEIEKN
jgi:hypothetical protein